MLCTLPSPPPSIEPFNSESMDKLTHSMKNLGATQVITYDELTNDKSLRERVKEWTGGKVSSRNSSVGRWRSLIRCRRSVSCSIASVVQPQQQQHVSWVKTRIWCHMELCQSSRCRCQHLHSSSRTLPAMVSGNPDGIRRRVCKKERV